MQGRRPDPTKLGFFPQLGQRFLQRLRAVDERIDRHAGGESREWGFEDMHGVEAGDILARFEIAGDISAGDAERHDNDGGGGQQRGGLTTDEAELAEEEGATDGAEPQR